MVNQGEKQASVLVQSNHFLDYGEIHPETGTREKPEDQDKRYNEILKGRTTIIQSPDPKEVFREV